MRRDLERYAGDLARWIVRGGRRPVLKLAPKPRPRPKTVAGGRWFSEPEWIALRRLAALEGVRVSSVVRRAVLPSLRRFLRRRVRGALRR